MERRAGFTLIEMMIAMLLALVVMGAAAQAFVTARQTAEVATRELELLDRKRVALDLLRRDLEAIHPCAPLAISYDDGDDSAILTFCTASPMQDLDMDPTTTAPGWPYPGEDRERELVWVRYEVVQTFSGFLQVPQAGGATSDLPRYELRRGVASDPSLPVDVIPADSVFDGPPSIMHAVLDTVRPIPAISPLTAFTAGEDPGGAGSNPGSPTIYDGRNLDGSDPAAARPAAIRLRLDLWQVSTPDPSASTWIARESVRVDEVFAVPGAN